MKRSMQILLSLFMAVFAGIAMADIAPDELVKKTAEEVLAVVKADKAIQSGDQQKIFALAEEKILPNFDFERVARMVLGKHWRSANPEQQAAFKREFRSLMLRTYASALSKYQNQTIEFKPLRMKSDANNVTVESEIIQPGGQPIGVDYSLHKGGDGWKVYDIVIEGVSLVTNYRGQFNNEIRQSGIDGLIKKLGDKNKQSGAS
jgi:phospholipid transport system substrate-binding protein